WTYGTCGDSCEEETHMRTRFHLYRLMLLIAIILIGASSLHAQDPELVRHFDYDQKAPLGIKEIGIEHRGSVTIYDITYVSPKGGEVPSFLVVPTGKGPFAAIIWGHWYWENS